MDKATLIGMFGAATVVALAIILGGNPAMFISIPGLLIVVGGTLGITLAMITLPKFLQSFKIIGKAFSTRSDNPTELIEQIIELAKIARKDGALALEDAEIDNPFLKRGVMMIVDGHSTEVINTALTREIDMMLQRHETGQKMMRSIYDVAPAMGMIGTLVGLVQMLASLDDPASIGPAMATALLTTLYGAFIAQAIALPIYEKLVLRTAEEEVNKSLVLEGVKGIQEGLNPKVLEELLNTFLPASARAGDDADEAKA